MSSLLLALNGRTPDTCNLQDNNVSADLNSARRGHPQQMGKNPNSLIIEIGNFPHDTFFPLKKALGQEILTIALGPRTAWNCS